MRVNEIIRFDWKCFDPATGLLVPGEAGNFVATLQKDNGATAEIVTIAESSEIGGDYQGSFTPLSGGVGTAFKIYVTHAVYNTQGWSGSWEVLDNDADSLRTIIDTVYDDTNEMQGKLPTNYIMGSSVTTNKDDEIDAIFGKLPTDYIMGSSVLTSKDDEIDDILSEVQDGTYGLSELQILLAAIRLKTDTIVWTDVVFNKDILGGKRQIISNQEIRYKADNLTEVARFDLFNSAGVPSMKNVFRRDRV